MRAKGPRSHPTVATAASPDPRAVERDRPLRVLFAVHDWGLGHATRDLGLIRGLLGAGHHVTVLSNGRALNLLRAELGDHCGFIAMRDIPKPLSRWPAWFYVKMSLSMPMVLATFQRERALTRRLHRQHGFDRIVSDSRFGVSLPEVPSYYLFHSLRQIIPGRPYRLEQLVEYGQRRLLRRARAILVPDLEHDGLAGDLCHNPYCDWGGRLHYLGNLASVRRVPLPQDVDCFISISGAEPQRSLLERVVLRDAHRLPGRVVVALGRPERKGPVRDDGHVAVHPYLDRQRQEEMLNRAKLVVCRSGYSTLMELAELHRPALFVPTPGQSEQEYLAEYHHERGHVYAVPQCDLDLVRDVARARTRPGLPPVPPSDRSVARFLRIVTGTAPELTPQ